MYGMLQCAGKEQVCLDIWASFVSMVGLLCMYTCVRVWVCVCGLRVYLCVCVCVCVGGWVGGWVWACVGVYVCLSLTFGVRT